MFDMTNDSSLFRTDAELEADGWYPVAGGRWQKSDEQMLPLYEGKMVQAYDHRAASVVINPANLHRPAISLPATPEQHANAQWMPQPQYWIDANAVTAVEPSAAWYVGFKEITAPTNARSMIAALLPRSGFGNKVPLWAPLDAAAVASSSQWAPHMLANLNCFAFDFVVRQKLQGQTPDRPGYV